MSQEVHRTGLCSSDAPTEIEELVQSIFVSSGISLDVDVRSNNVGGFLAGIAETPFICVDPIYLEQIAGQSIAKKRFILAHEVAHILNRDIDANSGSDRRPDWQMEVAADWFAAHVSREYGADKNELFEIFRNCDETEFNRDISCDMRMAIIDQVLSKDYQLAETPRGTVGQPNIRQQTTPRNFDLGAIEGEIESILESKEEIRPYIESEPAGFYRVALQAGHLFRDTGATGSQGKFFSEQDIAAYIVKRVHDYLANYGIGVVLLDGDPKIEENISVDVFISIHADASSIPCTSGPSFGYPSSVERSNGVDAIASALAISYDYKVTDFLRDNYTSHLRNYYLFRKVESSTLSAVLEIGDLGCPEQELNMAENSQLFARNLASAIKYLLD